MSRWWRQLGLRGRLAIALAGVALLSVALATGLTDSGLSSRLEQSARERMATAAAHSAQLAGVLYEQQRSWTGQMRVELGHVAAVSGYRLSLYDQAGHLIAGQAPRSPAALARAPVAGAGAPAGTVVLTPLDESQVLTSADRKLRGHLNTLHLIAALVALAGGVLAAVLLAAPLAGPLRALTDAASRIERGELDARVKPAGTPEVASLGRAFNRLGEALAREEQIRRAAAADVTHELRTPLAGIVSRVEAAQDGVLTDQQRNLQAIHDEALRLSQLVDDLGKLAEAEQPGLTLKKQQVELAGLVTSRVAVWRERLQDKQIAVVEQLEPAQIEGDRQRLSQVIDNLLSNALRYTDPGGTVTVALNQRDGEALLQISDTGIGIRGKDLPHIFERFWRGEPSRARRTGGAGIGLAIAQELVRAHGGRIDVQSKPKEGSTFRVALPATGR